MRPKIGNSHTQAVHLATNQIDAVIKAMDNEGHFMGKAPSAKSQARLDRIANAPKDVQALLGQGFSPTFVDRLARLSEDD